MQETRHKDEVASQLNASRSTIVRIRRRSVDADTNEYKPFRVIPKKKSSKMVVEKVCDLLNAGFKEDDIVKKEDMHPCKVAYIAQCTYDEDSKTYKSLLYKPPPMTSTLSTTNGHFLTENGDELLRENYSNMQFTQLKNAMGNDSNFNINMFNFTRQNLKNNIPSAPSIMSQYYRNYSNCQPQNPIDYSKSNDKLKLLNYMSKKHIGHGNVRSKSTSDIEQKPHKLDCSIKSKDTMDLLDNKYIVTLSNPISNIESLNLKEPPNKIPALSNNGQANFNSNLDNLLYKKLKKNKKKNIKNFLNVSNEVTNMIPLQNSQNERMTYNNSPPYSMIQPTVNKNRRKTGNVGRYVDTHEALFNFSVISNSDVYKKYEELRNYIEDIIGGKRLLVIKKKLIENLSTESSVSKFKEEFFHFEMNLFPLILHLHHLEMLCVQ
ncbi:hypothetical protein A3Q56_02328 [Intoshia linei]|uniref:Uncharacterized protein n=1 Tax=Intoshia linei TaxID=1819745 RepID=A0A177B6K7_9BILA|nr:hypothetical protein A3Q56_02328 [Intoshia linei]